MNAERILKLADVIEAARHKKLPSNRGPDRKLNGFNMSEWHCGTVGCIAGWAAEVFDCRISQASDALGLSRVKGDQLFIALGLNKSMDSVTPIEAAAVLRNLAATGRVDWSIAAKASQP